MESILVLRGGALGDLIVTLPALAALRQRWPAARIELVGNATAGVLARDAGLVDTVHPQHGREWSALYSPSPLPPDFAARLAAFDLVLNFWLDPDGDIAARFPLRPGQKFLAAPAVPTRAPAAAHFGAALDELGIRLPHSWWPLGAPAPGAELIALHPGSGSPTKNWPPDRWQVLATTLAARFPGRLRVVLGPAESAGLLAGVGESWRDLPLTELAMRLRDCRLFVGHDSGVSHLAAAAGVPSVLLFGPTDPAMWAPPAPFVQVVRRGRSLVDIAVADAVTAIESALSPPVPRPA